MVSMLSMALTANDGRVFARARMRIVGFSIIRKLSRGIAKTDGLLDTRELKERQRGGGGEREREKAV